MANNAISLLAGIMVLGTVFSVVPTLVAGMAQNPESLAAFPALADAVSNGQPLTADLLQSTIFSSGNEGLTFIWMPQLFDTLPFGRGLMVLFFLALSFAAFTSLMAMIELGTRVLLDAGVARSKAVPLIGVAGFVLGLPSAVSLQFLHNQDWVWGVALMVSGLFFAIAVIGHGARRFREQQLSHEHSDIKVGAGWDLVISVLVPLQALVLLVWWLYQARGWDPDGWLRPFAAETAGTVLFQFAIVLVLLIAGNRWIAARSTAAVEKSE
jgi:NSS family neurotransmitter:Na+ symporter